MSRPNRNLANGRHGFGANMRAGATTPRQDCSPLPSPPFGYSPSPRDDDMHFTLDGSASPLGANTQLMSSDSPEKPQPSSKRPKVTPMCLGHTTLAPGFTITQATGGMQVAAVVLEPQLAPSQDASQTWKIWMYTSNQHMKCCMRTLGEIDNAEALLALRFNDNFKWALDFFYGGYAFVPGTFRSDTPYLQFAEHIKHKDQPEDCVTIARNAAGKMYHNPRSEFANTRWCPQAWTFEFGNESVNETNCNPISFVTTTCKLKEFLLKCDHFMLNDHSESPTVMWELESYGLKAHHESCKNPALLPFTSPGKWQYLKDKPRQCIRMGVENPCNWEIICDPHVPTLVRRSVRKQSVENLIVCIQESALFAQNTNIRVSMCMSNSGCGNTCIICDENLQFTVRMELIK